MWLYLLVAIIGAVAVAGFVLAYMAYIEHRESKRSHVDYIINDDDFDGSKLSSVSTRSMNNIEEGSVLAIVKTGEHTHFRNVEGGNLIFVDPKHFTSHIHGTRDHNRANKHSTTITPIQGEVMNGDTVVAHFNSYSKMYKGVSNVINCSFSGSNLVITAFKVMTPAAVAFMISKKNDYQWATLESAWQSTSVAVTFPDEDNTQYALITLEGPPHTLSFGSLTLNYW